MSDQAATVADFLVSETRGMDAAGIEATVISRWPDISNEELARAIAIAAELLEAEAAEHEVTARTLRRGEAP